MSESATILNIDTSTEQHLLIFFNKKSGLKSLREGRNSCADDIMLDLCYWRNILKSAFNLIRCSRYNGYFPERDGRSTKGIHFGHFARKGDRGPLKLATGHGS